MLRAALLIIGSLLAGCGHPALDGNLSEAEINSYLNIPAEQVLAPQQLEIPLLHIYGGRSQPLERTGRVVIESNWLSIRARYRLPREAFLVSHVFVRPVIVTVQNLSQRKWRNLRTSLRIAADAVARCGLLMGTAELPAPAYRCLADRPL